MAQPQPPPIPEPLDTPQLLQAYLNSCPIGLTYLNIRSMMTSFAGIIFPDSLTQLHIYGPKINTFAGIAFPPGLTYLEINGGGRMTSIAEIVFPHGLTTLYISGVNVLGSQFPPNLKDIRLSFCQISSLSGLQFPLGLTKLSLDRNQITSLAGVQFPPGLTELYLYSNQINSLVGVQFPHGLMELGLNSNPIASLVGVQFPPGLIRLYLVNTNIGSFEGAQFTHELKRLYLSENKITSLSLQGLQLQLPPGLTELKLDRNQITTLQGIRFPIGLTSLDLYKNQITSLEGAQFPPGLRNLNLDDNQITTLKGLPLPPGLTSLSMSRNQLTLLEVAQFPETLTLLDLSKNQIKYIDFGSKIRAVLLPNLTSLNLEGNPLESLAGIMVNEYVMGYFKHNYSNLYFRYLHSRHKRSKMAEQSALKAARQSQKATLKDISDLTQQSMQNQMKAVTSFLREGMTARAQQHADQLLRDKEEKSTTYEQSLFYAKLNEKMYPVPMIEELSMQDVLNYLNEHYYISVLHNCGGIHLMHLHKPGAGKLESGRTLKEYGVVSDDVLDIICGTQKGGFRHSRSKKRVIKRNKRSQKRSNKFTKN